MIGTRDIPIDDTLPQLPKALDVSVMKKILQTALFENTPAEKHCQMMDCEIVYVHYKPGKPCTVCYQTSIQDTATNMVTRQLYSARIFESGHSTSRFQKAQTFPLVQPHYGKPLIHIPELGMVVWSFPNDRKLQALPLLTNPMILQEKLLPALVVRVFGQDWTITSVTAEVMNYVPRYSCTIKVNLHIHRRQMTEDRALTLYAKTYGNQERGAHAYTVMHELWETHARKSGEFHMAQPVMYDTAHNIFWQLAVPGKPLLQFDMNSPDFANLLKKAGETIAVLHTLPVTNAQPILFEDLVSRLQQTNLDLSHLQPHVIQRLQAIITFLMAQIDELGDQPNTTLHGDLHLKNFIVNGTTVVMIDLDEVGRGSPFHDVGSCVSFILYHGLEVGMTEPRIKELVESFMQGYRRHVTWDVPEQVLRWYVVAALIDERVTRCLKKAKPGTMQQVERLLELAYRLASGDQKILIGGSLTSTNEHLAPTHSSEHRLR